MQTLSAQESAAQIQLLIDSSVAIQSQGRPLSVQAMAELIIEVCSSIGTLASLDEHAEVASSIRQDVERYLSPLSTLAPGMGVLFAGVCALITRQGPVSVEEAADASKVRPTPFAGSIYTERQLEFLFQTAISLFSADSLDACSRLLCVVLEQAPDFGAAHAASGMLAEREQDHEGALRCYQSAFALMPDHPRIPLVLVNRLIIRRRLEDAQALLDELKAKFCDHSEFWNLNASIAREQKRLHDALTYYGEASTLDPDNLDFPYKIIATHLVLGDFDSANRILDQFLSREDGQESPTSDTNTFSQETALIPFAVLRVRARALSGQAEAALQLALDLYESAPDSFDTGICLVNQQIAHSAFDSAGELLDTLKPIDIGQEIRLLLTRAELASARYEPYVAIQYAQRATTLDPTHIDAQRVLVTAQLMATDVAAAQDTMRKVDQLLKRNGSEDARYKWRNSFHAGFLKEFHSNPHAEKRLVEILQLPSLQKIIALAKLIEHEPGYLPASMGLLLQCRRHGVFDYDRPLPLPYPASQVIPRTIVQFWDNPEIPADIARLIQSWDRCAGFEHRIFNDHSALAFLEEHCTAPVLRAFRMANHPAMRADIFRLAYLAVRGGVYVDADDLCRHDIGPLLTPGFELILMQENLASIGNNFIAAAPGQPSIDFILKNIVDSVVEKQGNNVWFLTGPGALSSGFCRYYLQQLGRARSAAGVRVATVHKLYNFITPHIPCRHKSDDRHWNSALVKGRPLFRRVAFA